MLLQRKLIKRNLLIYIALFFSGHAYTVEYSLLTWFTEREQIGTSNQIAVKQITQGSAIFEGISSGLFASFTIIGGNETNCDSVGGVYKNSTGGLGEFTLPITNYFTNFRYDKRIYPGQQYSLLNWDSKPFGFVSECQTHYVDGLALNNVGFNGAGISISFGGSGNPIPQVRTHSRNFSVRRPLPEVCPIPTCEPGEPCPAIP